MKKVYFLALTMALALASCNQKNKEEATDSQMHHESSVTNSDTTVENTTPAETQAALYSCPMHPEVQGKKDSECPKCGMKLTEPVTKDQEEK